MDTAHRMLAEFDLPPSLATAILSPLGCGHINRTFLAQGADGACCVVQCINAHVFPDGEGMMRNFARVCGHLHAQFAKEGMTPAQANRRALGVIKTRAGADYARDENGSVWRCMPHVQHTHTFQSPEDTDQARRAAFAFGDFIRRLADLPPSEFTIPIPGFHDTRARFAAFEAAVKADRVGRAKDVAREIGFLENRASLAGELLQMGFPERVVHNDTKLNNVLFDADSGEALCVVDLDTVMPGLALHDFGDMARCAVNTAAEDERDLSRVRADEKMFLALAHGFRCGAGATLTRDEVACFPLATETITFELGMRFLTDHLDGDRYFRVLREGQNLDRARVHFRLLESLEAAKKRLLGGVLDAAGAEIFPAQIEGSATFCCNRQGNL